MAEFILDQKYVYMTALVMSYQQAMDILPPDLYTGVPYISGAYYFKKSTSYSNPGIIFGNTPESIFRQDSHLNDFRDQFRFFCLHLDIEVFSIIRNNNMRVVIDFERNTLSSSERNIEVILTGDVDSILLAKLRLS